MTRRSAVFLCSFCLALSAFGQSKRGAKAKTAGPGSKQLVSTQIITAKSEFGTIFGQMQCDSHGNVYLGDGPSAVTAVRKLSPKGERLAVFEAVANPDFRQLDIAKTIALKPGSDELYQLVFPHEITRYVFVYKPDGSYKSAIKLEPGFAWMPSSFALFESGELLITGLKYDRDGNNARWPFTGIFSWDGTLLKEVKLEDDKSFRDMAVAGDNRVSSAANPWANHAIEFSQMAAAADGNIYLVRWSSPAIFYAISAGGEVVRRFTVDSGEANLLPIGMHIAGSRIATVFFDRQSKDTVMKIVDLQGREIASYTQSGQEKDSPLSIIFACYSQNPEQFTFLRTDNEDHLQFVTAKAK